MAPRLDHESTKNLWIAVLLTALLFVIALALALMRLGSYDSTPLLLGLSPAGGA